MAIDVETYAAAKAYTDSHGGGGGGTSNYNQLSNKPQINGIELSGNKSSEDLGLESKLTEDITAAVDVGGVDAGTVFVEGTSIETVLGAILSPTLYPTLTAPSGSMAISPNTKLFESGSSHNVTFVLTLNRGSINPAYGTSGYRSGAATSYTLDGTTQTTNSFTKTITASGSYTGSIAYAAGEQPKDSRGNNYGTPLAAGSVNTNAIAFEFVNAIWANTSNITTVAKQSLVSKSTKVKQFNFPAQTVANPEIFDVPSAWTVTAVEVLNTLSNQWEDCSSEFTVTSTTHEDAGGNTVNYARYTDNRGYAAGARSVRVKWS